MRSAALFVFLLTSIFGLAAFAPVPASNWQCVDADGCDARITENGEVLTVTFRKGDIISEESGWVISGDDGWVKLRNDPRPKPEPPPPRPTRFKWWNPWTW